MQRRCVFVLDGIGFVIQSDASRSETRMKALARIGAILSFGCFFFSGGWLVLHSTPGREPGVIILGVLLMGIAFFAGPMLWLAGEKCCSKQNGR